MAPAPFSATTGAAEAGDAWLARSKATQTTLTSRLIEKAAIIYRVRKKKPVLQM